MITKTEVLKAIAGCEKFAGFASIDSSPLGAGAITAGDLHTLIEAAKCARYQRVGHDIPAVSRFAAPSDSDWALDDDSTPKPIHKYDGEDDDT